MTRDDVNVIIAEFMGYGLDGYWYDMTTNSSNVKYWSDEHTYIICPNYHNSLDALVPVWEKLKGFDRICIDIKNYNNAFWLEDLGDYDSDCLHFTSGLSKLANSAAEATAKAILENSQNDK